MSLYFEPQIIAFTAQQQSDFLWLGNHHVWVQHKTVWQGKIHNCDVHYELHYSETTNQAFGAMRLRHLQYELGPGLLNTGALGDDERVAYCAMPVSEKEKAAWTEFYELMGLKVVLDVVERKTGINQVIWDTRELLGTHLCIEFGANP